MFLDRDLVKILSASGSAPRIADAARLAPRIADVARLAGVSTATVSRALSNSPLVADGTRSRVLAAVQASGYTLNVAARSLRVRRSMMALVVVPNIANSFFPQVLRGIDDGLSEAGYGIIIGHLDNSQAREARYVDLVFAGQFDGALLISGRFPEGGGRSMADAGLPLVAVSAPIPDADIPQVVIADRAASRAVVQHLVDLGHTRFGYVSGPPGHIVDIERYAGFREGLAAAGLDPDAARCWTGDFSFRSGAAAAQRFLADSDRPTAVYAVSDEMAIAFIKTVRDAGVGVPGAVSVVGFDGIDCVDYCEPTLTTVRQPRHQIGVTAARLLVELMTGAKLPARHILRLPSPLVAGASSGPAPYAP